MLYMSRGSVWKELPFVKKAEVSHKKGTAVITVTEAGHEKEIAEAVEKQGYTAEI